MYCYREIYTMFHLHRQSWGARQNETRTREGVLINVVPKMQVALAGLAFVVAVALVIGVK